VATTLLTQAEQLAAREREERDRKLEHEKAELEAAKRAEEVPSLLLCLRVRPALLSPSLCCRHHCHRCNCDCRCHRVAAKMWNERLGRIKAVHVDAKRQQHELAEAQRAQRSVSPVFLSVESESLFSRRVLSFVHLSLLLSPSL
jgi:hypothetical protein